MENHYETLGLTMSASQEEIRRAYRILARRYHPDVNPGKASAEERFKSIANAYSVLGDAEKKAKYDQELERFFHADKEFGFRAFQESQRRQSSARKRYMEAQERAEHHSSKRGPKPEQKISREAPKKAAKQGGFFNSIKKSVDIFSLLPKKKSEDSARATKVSVIEVSVSMKDAVYGVKKTVELSEPERIRKISVAIPPGVRNGSVVHLRSKNPFNEELVLIVRVPIHPFLSIQTRGIVAEVPITIQEAICGASISVPTLDEPISVKIPPGSSSGTEVRIPGKGMYSRDSSRGDLFVRFMIQVPQSPDAVGLKDKARELDQYYEGSIRDKLPKVLLS